MGRLADGGTVAFICASGGNWGIEISGDAAPRIAQQKPAQIEVYRGGENAGQLASGYQSVQKTAGAVVAMAKLAEGHDEGILRRIRLWRPPRDSDHVRGAAALQSRQSGLHPELPGWLPLWGSRALAGHGTRCMAPGMANPEAEGGIYRRCGIADRTFLYSFGTSRRSTLNA
jgi:hypothetical protein